MPFPWKKAKVTRISRLVADLHQSPKRGGSLVVETGFPTSLIDLFVKNRDRLRKSPKRKFSPSPQIQTQHQTPSTPPPLFPSPRCTQEPQSLQEPESARIDSGKVVLIERERECVEVVVEEEEAEEEKEAEEKIAFRAAFKIFGVAALVVSTTNLALWIMMAAFLLVLIEFVGTRFCCSFGFLRRNSKTRVFLGSWIRNCLLVLKRINWEQGGPTSSFAAATKEKGTTVLSDSCGLIELENGNCVGEIQIEEPKLDYSPDWQRLENLMRVEELLEKSSESLIITKTELSRRAKIRRTFVKKFVPKKLRDAKKKYKGKSKMKKKEELDEIVEEKQILRDDDDGGDADDDDDDDDDDGEVQSQQTEEGSCKGVEEVVSTSVQLVWVDSETVKDEEKNVRKGGNSGFSTLLMIVLLSGLVAGRGVALLFTLLWCLMLIYIGRRERC